MKSGEMMEVNMPINWRAVEREEQHIENELAAGNIDVKEYNRQMRELQRDVEGEAQDDAERAYRDAMGW